MSAAPNGTPERVVAGKRAEEDAAEMALRPQTLDELQIEQAKAYDQREREKKEEYERKIQLEKQMRDKQVKDENKRKKVEKRKEN